MYPRISINIVTWNSMAYIPELLESISKQTYTNFNVLIVDNASTDGIELFLKEKFPRVTFIRNARNLGFSGAHNQGIRYALEHWGMDDLADKFILVNKPEFIFTPTYLERLVESAEQQESFGVFGGKLLRAYGERLGDELLRETVKSDLIDSTGLRFHKNFTCTDRGAGEMDKGQFEDAEEVFAICGASMLIRAQAFQDVRYQDEFFDHDFFAFEDDVDLAFRMHYMGWNAWYEPKAVAYHCRGRFGQENRRVWSRLFHSTKKSRASRYYSVRNHWLFLLKNLDVISLIVLFPRLFLTEFVRCLRLFFFDWANIRAIFDTIRLIPRILAKRRSIQQTKKVRGKYIRKQFAH